MALRVEVQSCKRIVSTSFVAKISLDGVENTLMSLQTQTWCPKVGCCQMRCVCVQVVAEVVTVLQINPLRSRLMKLQKHCFVVVSL